MECLVQLGWSMLEIVTDDSKLRRPGRSLAADRAPSNRERLGSAWPKYLCLRWLLASAPGRHYQHL